GICSVKFANFGYPSHLRVNMASKLIILFFYYFHSKTVLALDPTKLLGNISVDPSDIKAASLDFGNISHIESLAVLYPNSALDIVHLVKKAYRSPKGFNVSARGNGHSTNGQSQVANGVVIDMSGTKAKLLRSEPAQGPMGPYVDVWGGDLWINVLNWTLRYGLAPKSWTNYLDLTVGGTLSNAGIGGQSYVHGPQTSNVYELDVVTGKGELITCSKGQNSKLFYGVLGGLGQFGIITRARIALETAPESAFLIEATYYDFSVFTKDQEYLASLHDKPASERFDGVLGYVYINQGVVSYVLEVIKYFSKSTEDTARKEIDILLVKLDFIPSTITRSNFSYVAFLDRLRQLEADERKNGTWNVPHPWIDLFVPKSGIAEFEKGIFRGILGNSTNGYLAVYPLNRNNMGYSLDLVSVIMHEMILTANPDLHTQALPFCIFVSQLLTVVGYGIREDEVVDPRDKVINHKYWEKSRKYMVAKLKSESEEGLEDSETEADPIVVGQATVSWPAATTVPVVSTRTIPHNIASLYSYMES
ncbi:hypothetical protein GIB67_017384, partial [Kingdonia uniflora]